MKSSDGNIKVVGDYLVLGLTVKSLITIAIAIATVVGMYYNLQGQIAEARTLPKATPNDVTRMEFDMKDQNIRLSIENTEKSVDEIKTNIRRMEDKIDDLK